MRDLPAEHDSADLMAAMAEAATPETPALGVYFKEDRPTLGNMMDEIALKAGGPPAASAGQNVAG